MNDATTCTRRLATAAICLLAACVAAAPPAMVGTGPANPAAATADFARVANQARVEAGCSALVWHAGVAGVAQGHSEDMHRRDYFDHESPEGRTPMQRVQAAGVGVMAVAENIAHGQATGQAVLRSWMDSAGHRRNLLNCEYTHHGVGLAGAYWTHVLVRLR